MYPRLKQFRESLGMTQEEFGKSLNIAKSTYNNYETGIRDPKSDFWIAVAKKYNVTIDYLMGFSDSPHVTDSDIEKKQPPAQGGEPLYPPEYDLLSQEDKDLVDNMIRSLAKKKQAP